MNAGRTESRLQSEGDQPPVVVPGISKVFLVQALATCRGKYTSGAGGRYARELWGLIVLYCLLHCSVTTLARLGFGLLPGTV